MAGGREAQPRCLTRPSQAFPWANCEYTTIIRDGIDRYGINKESAEGWIQSIAAKADQKSGFAIATGTRTGLQVTCDLRYDGSKNTQVIIVHVNPL